MLQPRKGLHAGDTPAESLTVLKASKFNPWSSALERADQSSQTGGFFRVSTSPYGASCISYSRQGWAKQGPLSWILISFVPPSPLVQWATYTTVCDTPAPCLKCQDATI